MSSATITANPLSLLVAPPVVAIGEFLCRHQLWIETAVGCPLVDTIAFEFHLPFDHLILSELFAGLPIDNRCISYTSALRPVVTKWETPPETALRIELGMSRNREAGFAAGRFGWEPSWQDTPLAIWLKGCAHALVSASVSYMPFTDQRRPASRSLLIVNKGEMANVLRILEKIEPPKRIVMIGGRDISLPANGYCWDSVIMNTELERFVQHDFEAFFEREHWFHEHNLPFRRGYLFYGPPGNGKTSAARMMACHPAVRAFGVDFRAAQHDPYSADQLSDLFEAAAAQAPSVVILEDIDKVGAGEPEALQQAVNVLLSCMDGLMTEAGVIVIATANNPSALSNALLKRPGRFDRTAQFPAPTAELRRRYLTSLSAGKFKMPDAAETSLAMEGLSFAQIREAYIMAGQFAFDRGDDVTANDLSQAARQIRREGKRISLNGGAGIVGFSIELDESAVSVA